jgi:hypothetical protein
VVFWHAAARRMPRRGHFARYLLTFLALSAVPRGNYEVDGVQAQRHPLEDASHAGRRPALWWRRDGRPQRGQAVNCIRRDANEITGFDLAFFRPDLRHADIIRAVVRRIKIDDSRNVPMRALAFAASFMTPGGSGTEAEPAELQE